MVDEVHELALGVLAAVVARLEDVAAVAVLALDPGQLVLLGHSLLGGGLGLYVDQHDLAAGVVGDDTGGDYRALDVTAADGVGDLSRSGLGASGGRRSEAAEHEPDECEQCEDGGDEPAGSSHDGSFLSVGAVHDVLPLGRAAVSKSIQVHIPSRE